MGFVQQVASVEIVKRRGGRHHKLGEPYRFYHNWIPRTAAAVADVKEKPPALPQRTPPKPSPRGVVQTIEDHADAHKDFQPGRWQRVTAEADIRELADRFVFAQGIDHDAARALAEQAVESGSPLTLYRNGPHRIYVETLDRRVFKNLPVLLPVIDDLVKRYPLEENLSLTIKPRAELADPASSAEAWVGGGHMAIAQEVFAEPDRPHDANHRRQWWMPAGDHKSEMLYVLVHEWGHLIDHETDEKNAGRRPALHAHSDQMSGYGNKNDFEAVAEAFAEWYFSDGLTHNQAAQAIADWYEWE